MMPITIPKNITKGEELVVIPRKEYEEFSRWKGTVKLFKSFIPTSAQKKDLRNARKEYMLGKYLTFHELKRKLEASNTK